MKKGLAPLCAGMMLLLAGCGSDPREPKVTSTLDLLDQMTAKVAALTTAVTAAVNKANPDKGIVLLEATAACEQLKTLAQKELQPLALKIQQLQQNTTPDEKKDLMDKFHSQVESGVTRLNDKWLALHNELQKLKKLSEEDAYAGSRDAVNNFLTRTFAETVGEFNSLNRQLK